ncbi:MAG: cyclic pyranopterin monophosphate synthase MoaC [Gammaproteobacteria bacterium]|nr:cyclic pyranopterin monophosphate synthase MoaC [Gammaproteobacteria bacterium]|tara:strand:- start:200 stop:664 length:465 start_codon:yes stop_codon:yes gene_type:complete
MNKNNNTESDQIRVSDISNKEVTERLAVSEGYISLSSETLSIIKQNSNKKGNVIATAKVAGIMAAKQTSNIIPLTHPLSIENIEIEFTFLENKLKCQSTVCTSGKTGVEIEALLATEICLLTVYDMCKYIDKSMIISDIKLLKKTGGKSGDFQR